jgi:hypothetical protein
MTDYFAQEATIQLSQPADPWRIAEDIRSLLEILFGENWKDTDLDFTATSKSDIAFRAKDLTSLQEEVTEFGGPMRDISIHADLWQNRESRGCDPMVLFSGQKAQRVLLSWHMPMRVETEAFRYGIERVIKDFGRRKRWTGAILSVDAMRHQSQAGPSPEAKGPQLIKVRGVKWGLRRWFVRNRDNIIIGLLVSFLVSIGIIVLQLVDLVPVPT